MREILFRGKRKDNLEWFEGYLFDDDAIENAKFFIGSIIIEEEYPGYFAVTGRYFYEVDPETVGQYTGLTDNTKWEQLTKEEQSNWLKFHTVDEWNGKMIFEGDIVRQIFEKNNIIVSSDWENDEYGDLYGEDVGEVVIIPSKGVCIKNPIIHREVNGDVTEHKQPTKMYKNVCSRRCEVIGNIHDNPELLKGVD